MPWSGLRLRRLVALLRICLSERIDEGAGVYEGLDIVHSCLFAWRERGVGSESAFVAVADGFGRKLSVSMNAACMCVAA